MNRDAYFEGDARRAWFALKAVPGLGEMRIKRLVEHFGSAREIFSAGPDALLGVEGIGAALKDGIRFFRPDRKGIDSELERVDNLGYHIVALGEPLYPRALYAIDAPPVFLYIKGGLSPADDWSMAVVGSRRASDYGRRMTEELAGSLVERGFTIISGMAWGIDQTAHHSAIQSRGRTIGVLGCGLDVVYPVNQDELRHAVSEHGALLTEFPLGTPPDPGNFPQRNRIISGLSMGTVVVEAAQRSGSLITARLALGQGREVFAVPGRAGNRGSAGTHFLIKQGAKLIEGLDDIIEEFPEDRLPPAPGKGREKENRDGGRAGQGIPVLNEEEQLIYKGLSNRPRHIDELSKQNKLSSSRTAGVLLQLELKGAARQLSGNFFIRT